jgi:Putative MetA-pathway of phenol degradation
LFWGCSGVLQRSVFAMHGTVRWLPRLAVGAAMLAATAASSSADKSQYSLFNPTPDRLLRDMTTDRPDITESPFTVDAGRVQIETNLFGYFRSRPEENATVTDIYDVAISNLRIGLTNNVELSLVWQPYGFVRTREVNPVNITHQSGTGRVDARAKINLWGNDSFEKPGASALALLRSSSFPRIATTVSARITSTPVSSCRTRSSSRTSSRSASTLPCSISGRMQRRATTWSTWPRQRSPTSGVSSDAGFITVWA